MNKERRNMLGIFSGLCAAAAMPGLARAQKAGYPANAVSIVVPFGAGGSTDYLGRLVANDLSSRYPGKFIVENKPGAGASIGTRFVATAPPDGRTLLYSTATPFSINPYIYKTLPYDPDHDFTPAAMTVEVPLVLVVSRDMGINTLQELIDHLLKNEATSSYGSYGAGTSGHIGGTVFARNIGAPGVLHVPYKDTQAVSDLVERRTTYMVDAWTPVAPFVASGRLVVLGVCGNERLPWIPEVPTISSVINRDFDMSTWHAIFAPRSTEDGILDFLNDEIKITMAKDSVRKSAASQGFKAYPHMSRNEVQAFILADRQRWKNHIEMAGIQRV